MSVSVFAERLRNAMNSRGLKQVDLVHAAEHRGVKMGKSHISQYVAGKTMPREDVLEFLASELDVDTNWLRGEESTTQLNSDASNSVTDGEHAATPLAMGAAKPQTDSEIPVGRRRTFGKSHKLDNVLYDVRGPVADEAMRMEANGTHILKLNIGNPAPFGFRTPDEVVYDMAHQLTDTEGYSPSKGLFSARKAIMQYAQLKNIPNVTIDDIYTGNGVSELINLSMSALLDTGDEVLVPSPDYPLWTACATLAGGTAVHYVCDEKANWYPDIDDIKSKVTPRTKGIVVLEDEMRACCDHLYMMTDDGTYGEKGLVTNKLQALIDAGEQYDEVIAIGPVIMMKFVAATTKPYGIKTLVSLNPIMIDGTGMCGGCRLTVGGQTKFACVDGPDFDGDLVDFDEAMARGTMYRPFEAHAREAACNLFKTQEGM